MYEQAHRIFLIIYLTVTHIAKCTQPLPSTTENEVHMQITTM